jgi:hypothetical protein
MNNSNYTGRTSRTLNEAFGPYASREISEPPIMSTGDMVVIATCLLGILVLIVLGVTQ